MIFKKEDIAEFYLEMKHNRRLVSNAKLHEPTGVFWINEKNDNKSPNEVTQFYIGQLDNKGNVIDDKVFLPTNQKIFFEAVDYFETLIKKRQPQPEQEAPSVGIFIYIKNSSSFVEVFGNKVTIRNNDIAKVFTPPVKKKFGRLNMYASDNPKYDVIKGKFALDFDEKITEGIANAFNAKLGAVEMIAKENIFVYKMTPYDTSEEGEEADPKDVNNDSLDLNDIEGEDPKNMTGEDNESQDGEPQGGEPQDSEPQDGEPQDSEPQDGEPQDSEPQDGKPQDGKPQDGDPQDGDPQDGQSQDGEPQDGEPQDGEPQDDKPTDPMSDEKLREVLNNSIPRSYLEKDTRLEFYLDSFSTNELKSMFGENIVKKDLIERAKKLLKK